MEQLSLEQLRVEELSIGEAVLEQLSAGASLSCNSCRLEHLNVRTVVS
jgi:hypothetical protein